MAQPFLFPWLVALVGQLHSGCMVVVDDGPLCTAFVQWHAKWRAGSYNEASDNFAQRVRAFSDNAKRIEEVQARNPLATFSHGKYGDWTTAEYRRLCGHVHEPPTMKTRMGAREEDADTRTRSIPESKSWKAHLTAVRDQGQCGSCWAHAAVETVSAFWSIKKGVGPTALSVQQVVSCDLEDSNCDGGQAKKALDYIHKYGVESETAYPIVSGHMSYNCGGSYIWGKGDYCTQATFEQRCLAVPNTCPADSASWERAPRVRVQPDSRSNNATFCVDGQCALDYFGCCLTSVAERAPTSADEAAESARLRVVARDALAKKATTATANDSDNTDDNTGKQCLFNSLFLTTISSPAYVTASTFNESAFLAHVGTEGPLAIALDATDVMHYTGGVMTSCQRERPDHAVQLVGYGSEHGVDYWVVRNSWGASWGESGYFRLQRGQNTCNMDSEDGWFAVPP